ncbi:DUF1648 domain-containing protein [Hoyosella subflava]|uniref:DUF1648 domain-containing protein n=1 Tax=Hoyosella subflava (strain DSM 45089 / JCM 17490 / NBRC 109087 / DQS3-9A1) TaxID=443218 RepID=F6ERM2_HOYSD|nr:DUF1648 domain-containing protein [Hoyosella subflava]AEF39599.1 hypothetical protein AS9A_1147 [Hoyosella subflava DQS3-9A1]
MGEMWQDNNPRWKAYLGFPALVVAATMVTILMWLPDLPNQIATQWSADGQVTSQSSPTVMLITYLLPIFVALFIPLVIGHYQTGDSSLAQWGIRLAYALGWFVTVLISALVLLLLSGQRGAQAAFDAPAPSWSVIVIAFAAALVSGVAGATLAPVTKSETRP